jgi:hypothetical protein
VYPAPLKTTLLEVILMHVLLRLFNILLLSTYSPDDEIVVQELIGVAALAPPAKSIITSVIIPSTIARARPS